MEIDILNIIFRTGKCFDIDIYGQGPHTQAIQAHAEKNDLPVRTTENNWLKFWPSYEDSLINHMPPFIHFCTHHFDEYIQFIGWWYSNVTLKCKPFLSLYLSHSLSIPSLLLLFPLFLSLSYSLYFYLSTYLSISLRCIGDIFWSPRSQHTNRLQSFC